MSTPTLPATVRRREQASTGTVAVQAGAFRPAQLWTSLPDALRKLAPRAQLRNPVMSVVWTGSVLVTVDALWQPTLFGWLITVWLWFTVLFANLAEAVAVGRGKAQTDWLRRTKRDTVARQLRADGVEEHVGGTELRIGDWVVVEAGETIPGDGDIVEGIATVDESTITGESAPVVRGRRRPLRGDRRDHGTVRPDRRGDHDEAGRDARGPDDRTGRGCLAAEDAQRDRSDPPAGPSSSVSGT